MKNRKWRRVFGSIVEVLVALVIAGLLLFIFSGGITVAMFMIE
jgi:hypothetical protein